jgi:hypothetical protein
MEGILVSNSEADSINLTASKKRSLDNAPSKHSNKKEEEENDGESSRKKKKKDKKDKERKSK